MTTVGDHSEIVGDVEEFIAGVVKSCGLELSLRTETSNSSVDVRLEGPDSDIILLHGARVLHALNDVVNQIFYRKTGLRIEVDCNDYRSMRQMELELLARKAAERVGLTGRPYRLQPMPPGERRTIHMALADEDGIHTESKGNGDQRHVVIIKD